MDFLEFPDVFKEDRGAMTSGRLKMTNQGVVFKNSKTGKVEQVQGSEMESISWQRLGAGYGLRIMMKTGGMYRFGGFQDDEQERLAKFFQHHFELPLASRELCLKGWNWGTARFEGSVLSFDVDKSSAYEIPLGNVSHCTTAKNEVTLEFHQNDDAAVSLMELRFHIPTDPNSDMDAIQAFRNNVLSKASIIQATGDAMVTFKELQCLTPRGRYDIKIFPSFIQLHGKTFDYKIPLTTVLRLFLLPHKDNRQVFFVLSLDPPIKQGQTRYHFLILLFNKEEETSIELALSDADIQEKFEDKLQKNMSGPTFEVISRVMKAVVQRKITVPGNFKGHGGTNCITCSYRAGNGLLYPLERGFIYIHKPPVHIRFDEIACVNFARSGGSTRSFDFEVEAKSGLVHTFSSIEKEEYGRLFDYVSDKKLRIKNRGSLGTTKEKPNYQDDELIDSDAEDAPDAYLARVKDEGRQRDEVDSDESSDESFNPGESGSEVAEEFDSNVESSSDSEAGSGGGKGSGSGSGSETRDKPKKEKKSKSAKTVREPGMKPRKPRRPKKERDANKPKRPPSAYFLWLAENRDKIKKDNPGFSITDVTKRAGELWKEVTDKSKWEEQAAEAAAKYKEDMAAYQASLKDRPQESDDEKEDKKPVKKSKPASTPKPKPTSSSPLKGNFKSKEYISSSGSSDDEKSKKVKKEPKESPAGSPAGSPAESPKSSPVRAKSEDEEEASASTPASSGDENMSGSGDDD
ncbi:FACT complex subunit SSRP1 [Dermacentor andersoni]|uniref:FACT complex subunit SSRP1 n=1 Tax=Dermacentor andersoni TaxID=34620 RepID=UPI002155C6C8|nr:FACT complex subunit SSRP1-like [Dermacentor andersoni]